MNVLLDTCGLIALANGPLPPAASQVFGAAKEAFVSSTSAWEAAIKYKSGKLHLPLPPHEWFERLCKLYHLTELPLDSRTACAAALPLIHRDPFDRVLVATALEQHLVIITSDQIIPTYPQVVTRWQV